MSEPTSPIPDLPEQVGDHDCPICFEPNAIIDREAVCPNGHKLCADCQPRVQSVRPARCPLCRAYIPFIPLPTPAITEGERIPRYIVDHVDENGFTHMRPNPNYIGPALQHYVQPPRAPRPARVQDPDGRRGDPERPQRAIDGFNNLPARRAAQARFRHFRDEGVIPANARFGGIHTRNCPCGRSGGAQGVRFLKMPGGNRKYRCEVCYGAETNGGIPEEPPAWSWNGAALAAHNET
jgi:hypothetical protein